MTPAEWAAVYRDYWALIAVALFAAGCFSTGWGACDSLRPRQVPHTNTPRVSAMALIFDLFLIGKWVLDNQAVVAPLVAEAKALIARIEAAKAPATPPGA